ncbi:MAG: V-type ATPase 116kDa subunit family protein [Myxococcota bacterium]|nr:V-type ATPase 116kDa subunit family protein [Myxococcota bacterium]
MLRAVPMKRVLVLVPRADLDAVIEAVAALGVLHLLDLSGREEWSWARPVDGRAGQRACRAALRQVEALVRFYAPPPVRLGRDAPLPVAAEAERQVEAWSGKMETLRAERTRLRDAVERLERSLQSLAALAPSGLEPGRLREMRLLHPACGWIAAADLERVEEALARIPHRVVRVEARGDQQLVLAFALERDREILDRALRSAGWEPLAMADDDDGVPRTAEALEAELRETRARLREVDARCESARLELAEPLALARAAIERELLLLEARSFTARSESVVFVSGWIPEDRVEALRAATRRATRGRFHLVLEEPRSIDTVHVGADPVPILFRNPALVRPFERLVAAYGAPRWRELDPTPLVALAFWVMFGLMFGDVGHGAVLAGAGWWIFRRVLRYRDYGVILMECGIASMAFGFAYGSVFGLEHLLPALWFRPLDDVPRLLRVGAGFGLVFLSLSFALGVVNAVLRRDWSSAFLGAHGLLAALAYWIAAALGLRWLATGEAGIELGLAAALLGAPLALLWLSRVIQELRPTEGAAGGPVAAILGGAVELVDVVVSGIANTVSFVRLAAFAVSHAGLLLAVFAMVETVSDVRGGALWSALILVVGNAVIIALEGLIVSIQSVRLVYYEFFSRFHAGTGLEYRPLRLREDAVEEGRA